MFIPKRMPELWEKSAFHSGKGKLYAKSIIGGVSSLIMMTVLLLDSGKTQAIGMIIITIIAALFAHFRYRSGAVRPADSFEPL
jgi:APA family basic amino acid/polyamine antiporter